MPFALLDISISRPKPKKQPEVFRPRSFEDGSVEVQLADGRHIRQKPTICQGCGSPKVDHMSGRTAEVMAVQAGLCVPCYKQEVVAREQAIAYERAERQKLGKTSGQIRHVALVLATPLWRDREKIKEVYDLAKRMTEETGILYEVDHIYPIQSQFACGLHVHHNLQILEKTQNRSKGNKFPFHESSALWE